MINIAQVGIGYWGPNIAKSIELTGKGRLRWFCDLSQTRLDALREKYPEARTTTRIEEVLQDPEVQAVIISTPVSSHYRLAKQALEAGKHVLVEKPITSASEEAISLWRLASQKRLKLMVGHIFEYNTSILALEQIVRRGDLGEILYIHCERTNLGPVRTDANALWDLATHDISIVCRLLASAPEEVSAFGKCYLNEGVEDVVFSSYRFPSGALVNMHASWLNPRKVRQITVVGSKKMAVWDDLDLKAPVKVYNKTVQSQDPDKGNIPDTFLAFKTACVDGGLEIPTIRLEPPLQAECDHFLTSIINDSTPETEGYNAFRVVRVLEVATESLKKNGQWLPVNMPTKESLV